MESISTTKGSSSFIFPVHENGEKHMACLFGGATPPRGDENGRELQRQSINKFTRIAGERDCDVALQIIQPLIADLNVLHTAGQEYPIFPIFILLEKMECRSSVEFLKEYFSKRL